MVSDNHILVAEFLGNLLCATCLIIYGKRSFAKDTGIKVSTSDIVYVAGMVMSLTLMAIFFYLLYEGIKKNSLANLFVWHLTRGVSALLGVIASVFMLTSESYDAFVLITIVNVYLILSMIVIYWFLKKRMKRPVFVME